MQPQVLYTVPAAAHTDCLPRFATAISSSESRETTNVVTAFTRVLMEKTRYQNMVVTVHHIDDCYRYYQATQEIKKTESMMINIIHIWLLFYPVLVLSLVK